MCCRCIGSGSLVRGWGGVVVVDGKRGEVFAVGYASAL